MDGKTRIQRPRPNQTRITDGNVQAGNSSMTTSVMMPLYNRSVIKKFKSTWNAIHNPIYFHNFQICMICFCNRNISEWKIVFNNTKRRARLWKLTCKSGLYMPGNVGKQKEDFIEKFIMFWWKIVDSNTLQYGSIC